MSFNDSSSGSHSERYASEGQEVTLDPTDAELLVDGMGYLTALAKTDLSGHLDYTDRTIVKKLFQTFTIRIGRFHETWNSSQPALGAWLTAYAYYYNHLRSHQALDNQPLVGAAGLS